MSAWNVTALLLGAACAVLLAVRQQAWQRGRWGVNLQRMRCPACDAALPTIRKPTSRRQLLWGGWTCEACGTESDKWGRRVDRAA